jgi:hypothetical protein
MARVPPFRFENTRLAVENSMSWQAPAPSKVRNSYSKPLKQ